MHFGILVNGEAAVSMPDTSKFHLQVQGFEVLPAGRAGTSCPKFTQIQALRAEAGLLSLAATRDAPDEVNALPAEHPPRSVADVTAPKRLDQSLDGGRLRDKSGKQGH